MLALSQKVTSIVRPNNLRPLLSSATDDHNLNKTQKANICHKTKLYEHGNKPPYRFPYEKYPYNWLTMFWDPICRYKMNENSKIIIIEGNVASGKGDLGRRLADELDMKFMPQPDLEDLYINPYGFDYRSLNPRLPEHLRVCDFEMFHGQPTRHSVIHMQHYLLKMRAYNYLEAMAHLLNTGQGVILERSVFTERVFVEGMHKMGWLPIGYSRQDGCEFYDWRFFYNYMRKRFCKTMPAPHLTIYLDVPPEECHKRIRDSANKDQANSNALVPEFLQHMDDYYNQTLLRACGVFGHVLRYDNTKGIDSIMLQDIVDDIELLNFDKDHHDTKFDFWDHTNFKFWFHDWRVKVTSRKGTMMTAFHQPYYDIAGLGDVITPSDVILKTSIVENHVVGWKTSLWEDFKYNNWLKIMSGTSGNYRQREKTNFFADFL